MAIAQELGGLVGPVFDGLLDEVRQGEDEPAQIPDPYYHIGDADLFNPPPLVVDDHDIVDPDRLGEGDLDACNHVGQKGTGGQTDHDTRQPRGGQETFSDGPDPGDGHQRGGRRYEDDQHGQEPFDQEDACFDLPAFQVVLGVGRVPGQELLPEEMCQCDHCPGHCEDSQEEHDAGQDFFEDARERDGRVEDQEDDLHRQEKRGPPDSVQRRGGVRQGGLFHPSSQDGENDGMDDPPPRGGKKTGGSGNGSSFPPSEGRRAWAFSFQDRIRYCPMDDILQGME